MKAAIKILQTHLLTEAQIAAFQHEAKTVAELTHPHIVRVLDSDLQEGRPFLVLEYAPNGSLQKKHPRGSRVPLDQVVSYVQQVASALEYAHAHKLIHRDVKPENLLVGKQGEILLSDFGIVTLAHATSSMNTEAALGTLAYMAPEQIQGKPRKESDQYALAVTVYLWLTGTLPFGGSSAEIIAQHLGTPAPSLREIRPDLPAAVDLAVLTALVKDPQWRFGSVQAFANALTEACRQAPASAPLSLKSQLQASKPATIAPDEQLSRTLPARPALTPHVPAPAPSAVQPQRAMSAFSSRGGWFAVAACALIVIVVLAGMIMHAAQGDGTVNSPYHLSASDTGVQSIGITLKSSSAPDATVTSVQFTSNQTIIDLSVPGPDTYTCNGSFSLLGTSRNNSSSSTAPGSLSPGDYELTFASRPQAGEEWDFALTLTDQNYGGSYSYQDLYLQF